MGIKTLAVGMGVSQPFLSQVINGRRRAPVGADWAHNCAEALGLPPIERQVLLLLVQMTHDPRWGGDGRTVGDHGLGAAQSNGEARNRVTEPPYLYGTPAWHALAELLIATERTQAELLEALENSLVIPEK